MKKVKLSGVTLGRDGSVKSQEFHGPANISHWIASYTVLQNVLVMLDAVDLGNLLRYKSFIERLRDKYGEKVWSVIYQGEVRCRLEHMPRLKSIAQAEYDQTKASGSPTPVGYEPSRPWSYVWAKAVRRPGILAGRSGGGGSPVQPKQLKAMQVLLRRDCAHGRRPRPRGEWLRLQIHPRQLRQSHPRRRRNRGSAKPAGRAASQTAQATSFAQTSTRARARWAPV